MKIYGPPTTCLGDCWAFVNMIAGLSIRTKEVITCSGCVAPSPGQGFDPRASAKSKIVDIMSVLDMGEAKIKVVDKGANVNVPDVACFRTPYLPTTTRWKPGKPGRHGVICYQLTNSQEPENARCLREHHLKDIIGWIEANSTGVRLGLPMTIKECVEAAAASDLFIGIDSGMSHVCHSVGVPVLISDWERIDEFHYRKDFMRFSGAEQAIGIMKSILSRV